MKFIPDNEISFLSNEDDKLGTKVYSDTIIKIIKEKDNTDPFSLGLFGSWGSGKSSILKTVRSHFQGDKTIRCISYDAWKYSNDAFRRSFLLFFKNSLGLETTNELQNFYSDKHEDILSRVALSKKWWLHFIIWIPLLSLIIWFTAYTTSLQIIITILGLFLTGFAHLVKGTLSEYKISVSTPKYFSPEQFEDAFKEGVNSLINPGKFTSRWFKNIIEPRNKLSRIVIIFDNVDRCHKDLAKELLLTIKNFLNCENCIFIIPIDDEAIINHLGFQNEEGEEFLRKFFNVSIRIKKYSSQNLFGYTMKLIDDYRLGFSRKVAYLISKEFSKNPRRIIQFLNNLTSELDVAINQEDYKFISSGDITGNVDFMAKILIIKEEWPDFYRKLNSNFYLLKEIDELIREKKYLYHSNKGYWYVPGKQIGSVYDLVPLLYDFLQSTISVTIDNIEPFLRIRDFNKEIPDDIIEFIDNQKWSRIKEYMTKGKIDIEVILGYISKLIDLYSKSGLYSVAISPYLNLVFEILCDEEYVDKFDDYFEMYQHSIECADIKLILGSFNTNNLLLVSKKRYSKSSYLTHKIAAYLNENRDENAIVAYIEMYKDNIVALEIINIAFTSLFEKDITVIEKYENLLKRENINGKLLTNSFIDKIIIVNSSGNIATDFKYRVKIIRILNEYNNLSKRQINLFFRNILDSCQTNNIEKLLIQLDLLAGFVSRLEKDSQEAVFLYDTLKQRNDHFFALYYNNNARDKNIENVIGLIINLLTEYAITIERKEEILKILIGYLEQNVYSIHYLDASSCLMKIIEHYETYNWDFVNKFNSKYSKVRGDEKERIGKTLCLMMRKTLFKDSKLLGMTENDIKTTLSQFFDTYFSFSNDDNFAQNFIKESLSNEIIKPFFYDKIKEYKKPEQIKKIVPFGKYIEDDDFLSNMISISIESASDYSDLDKIIDEINKNNIKKRSNYIRKALITLLSTTTISKKNYLKDLIRCCVDNQDLLSIEDLELLTEKILNLFSTEEIDDSSFALERLKWMKKIPVSKKNLIKEKLKNINYNDEKNIKLLDEVRAKIK